ncbi:MAG: hypothetical protein ACRCZ2_13580 [Fusobacteriaceae bacterium]
MTIESIMNISPLLALVLAGCAWFYREIQLRQKEKEEMQKEYIKETIESREKMSEIVLNNTVVFSQILAYIQKSDK